MANKEEHYKRIRIVGMISYIPIILAAGPFGGFFLGEYLTQSLKLPPYVMLICIGLGFITSIRETVRIIRLVIKINDKS
jgi:hypothetical protein